MTTTFYDLVVNELEQLERQERRGEELFDELFRFLRADQRLLREGTRIIREKGLGTITHEDVWACEFRVAKGSYMVRDAGKQPGRDTLYTLSERGKGDRRRCS